MSLYNFSPGLHLQLRFQKARYFSSLLLPLFFTTACSETPDDNDVDSAEIAIIFEADLPYGSTEANVAAAGYHHGEPQPMIGGDVMQVTSSSESVYLQADANREHFYSAQLALTDPGLSESLTLRILHDPQGTRADRWYPTEEALYDPGSGPLFGSTASLTLPDELQILSPQPGLSYTSRTDDIVLEWTGAPADSLKLVAHNRCTATSSNSSDLAWVQTIEVTDDQYHSIRVGRLIPSEGVLETAGTVANVLTGFLQLAFEVTLSIATLGLYEAETIEFEDYELDSCSMTLYLVRQNQGELGEGVDGGSVTGSRSDSVTVEFQP